LTNGKQTGLSVTVFDRVNDHLARHHLVAWGKQVQRCKEWVNCWTTSGWKHE